MSVSPSVIIFRLFEDNLDDFLDNMFEQCFICEDYDEVPISMNGITEYTIYFVTFDEYEEPGE